MKNPVIFDNGVFGDGRGRDGYSESCVTLRDLFAGFAMVAYQSANPQAGSKTVAEAAYDMANAMLREREKP